ncbi:hypothetical protein SNEBB_004045 [Seison nebaliae]|nr:hypothetical protein SNEBB_004045 [Seison nebaliae]
MAFVFPDPKPKTCPGVPPGLRGAIKFARSFVIRYGSETYRDTFVSVNRDPNVYELMEWIKRKLQIPRSDQRIYSMGQTLHCHPDAKLSKFYLYEDCELKVGGCSGVGLPPRCSNRDPEDANLPPVPYFYAQEHLDSHPACQRRALNHPDEMIRKRNERHCKDEMKRVRDPVCIGAKIPYRVRKNLAETRFNKMARINAEKYLATMDDGEIGMEAKRNLSPSANCH